MSSPDFVLDNPLLREGALVYRALNHPLRQNLLRFIHTEGQSTVTEMYQHYQIEQSVVSQHLGILRDAGMVVNKRIGKYIYYQVNYDRLVLLHKTSRELLS
jgi:DNA-binding transcriptional ArsR family regulator